MENPTVEDLAAKNVALLEMLIEGANTLLQHTAAARSGYQVVQQDIDQMLRVAEQLARIPSMAADNLKQMHELS
jgi:hypothetical protein